MEVNNNKVSLKENPVSGGIVAILVIIGVIPVLVGVLAGLPFFVFALLIVKVFNIGESDSKNDTSSLNIMEENKTEENEED